MQLYWTIPELAELPKPLRRAAYRSCYLKTFRHWQVWCGLLAMALCTGLGIAIGESFVAEVKFVLVNGHHELVTPRRWPLYLGAAIGGGLGNLFFTLAINSQMRPYLRKYLQSADTHQQS